MNAVYQLTPKAEFELATERATIFDWRQAGKITSAQARDLYMGAFDRLSRADGALELYNPDSPIGIACDDCGRVHIMPISVQHFTCKCTPHIDRSTLRLRVVLA